MHPLIKVPTIVGTVISIITVVAGALSHSDVAVIAAAATEAVTILNGVSGFITVKAKAKKGVDLSPRPASAAKTSHRVEA